MNTSNRFCFHATAILGLLGLSTLALSAAASGADASATPRAADGHPDLNGTWDTGGGLPPLKPVKSADGSVCISCVPGVTPTGPQAPPPNRSNPDQPSYKPEFRAKVANFKLHQVKFDTSLHCRKPGVPRIGPPQKIVQTKGQVVFLYADITGDAFRIIPTDGRPHRTDISDSYLGDSVGHWEGDDLVVDDVNFNDDTWLADDGLFHSVDLRVVERLHRDGDTLHYQATVYDPKVLTQPWAMKPRTMKLTTDEIAESPPCVEQDFSNMTDESYHGNPR